MLRPIIKDSFKTVLLIALLLLFPLLFISGITEASGTQPLSNLEIGDRVVDLSWEWEFRSGNDYTYETGDVTKPVTWIVVAKDHYGPGSGVTLLSEELIGRQVFDNSTDRGSLYGSNHWGVSGSPNATLGLRKFLNGSSYTGDDSNNYDPSFYDSMSASFKNNIITTTLPNKIWDTGVEYSTSDKVFIPTTTELGDTVHDSTYPIGTVYSHFVGATNADRTAQLGGSSWSYWTRSPSSDIGSSPWGDGDEVRTVRSDGDFYVYYAGYWGSLGVRPALYMQSDTLVSAITNDDGAYEIILNDDADLFSLTVNPGTLDPAFDKDTTLYTVAVAHEIDSIDVTAILSDENATITIDGDTADSGVPNAAPLGVVGTATEIDIEITAEDGMTQKTYTIIVYRAGANAQALGGLKIGDKVVDPSWQWEFRTGNLYSGTGDTKPVTWIVVAKEHYGLGSGVTLLSEELIGKYPFDNSTDRGSSTGSNNWGASGLPNASFGHRPWLNSSGPYGGKGFYFAFSPFFKDAIVKVTLPNMIWDTGNDYNTLDNVFIPSTTELGDITHNGTYQIGTVYPHFNGATNTDRIAQIGDSNHIYWTRSPDSSSASGVRYVHSDGGLINSFHSDLNFYGTRPALNLQSETLVSLIPNDDGVYEVIFYNDDADLSSLTVSVGILTPAFTPGTTAYTVALTHEVVSIDVTAILSDEKASLTIDGEPSTSGEPETVTLEPAGTPTEIDIVVTAEDGVTEKTYTIFTTGKVIPTVTTNAASGVTGTDSATLNMTYTAGDYLPEVRFAYKKATDSIWIETSWVENPGSPYALPVSGLDSNTIYDFKAQLKYNSTEIEGRTLRFNTSLQGPVYPPPGGLEFSASGEGIGTAGGLTFNFSAFDPAELSALYWGSRNDFLPGIAFDGAIDEPGETLIFNESLSDLGIGLLTFTGYADVDIVEIEEEEYIISTITLNTRMTITVGDGDGVLELLPAEDVGLSDIGGLALVYDGEVLLDELEVNLLAEAYYEDEWHPALDLYNSLHTVGEDEVMLYFYGGFYYEVAVTMSDDASLSVLTVDPGELNPPFDPDTISYTVDVTHDVDSINITAILSDENASLTIAGEEAASGVAKSVALNDHGIVTLIDTVVTAEDGAAQNTYTITVNRATFTDVYPDHPFFAEIEELVGLGITTGWPDGTFRPTLPVTRQAMAAFLFRAFDLEVPDITEPTFTDVDEDHPFYEEIEALAASGITTGWPDGTFRPDLPVTRMATAAFLYRALGLIDPGITVPTFSDVPTDHPYFKEIEALAETGITTGWPDGTFRPDLSVTRQAIAALLIRALELEN